jgi:hypothetical protein
LHTQYNNCDAADALIVRFWSIVEEMSSAEQAKLLQFVTGSPKVPIGGFKNLRGSDGVQQFTISKSDMDESHLPQTSTCFNMLKLPEYSTKEMLREKLQMALLGSHRFEFV